MLVAILSAMIVLAAGQILLRNAFGIGFIWTDELLRVMVLWLAVAGAVAASRADRHINVAVLDQYVKGPFQPWLRAVTHGFTVGVCAVVTWFSLQFVLTTREYGDVLLGGVPAWWLQFVLPLGFALITWRYSMFLIQNIIKILRGETVR